jgi:hypothetical protein
MDRYTQGAVWTGVPDVIERAEREQSVGRGRRYVPDTRPGCRLPHCELAVGRVDTKTGGIVATKVRLSLSCWVKLICFGLRATENDCLIDWTFCGEACETAAACSFEKARRSPLASGEGFQFLFVDLSLGFA